MIQNVLQHIGGIQNYGMISLLLFFTLFGGLVLWAFSLRRTHLEEMARLPLEDGDPSLNSSGSALPGGKACANETLH